ncbi:hypothetical protein [Nocardioides campestrisoli]|uniref:hypothetical protein n=1 Tax=Nocardioides campestrisoli TaxID=2736757 RepID=UPI00163DE200|nr:hypothetical protein [Nocardioides campestrisoli]
MAAIAASAALAGSVIGGLVSLTTTKQALDDAAETRGEERLQSAYLGFLTEATELENEFRYPPYPSAKHGTASKELLSRLAVVEAFGSAESHLQARGMYNALTRALETQPQDASAAEWRQYDTNERLFLVEMRRGLDIEEPSFGD